MANENTFPQLPSTVWKGAWQLLRKSPNRKLDDSALAIELNVQATAAKQYLKELSRLGILDSDGVPTPLSNRWRQDGDDPEVILEILRGAYPEALLQLAPPGEIDRDKIVRWFMNQQLGEGAAKNKAATYIQIAGGVSAGAAPKARATTGEVPKKKRETATSAKSTSGATGQSAKTEFQRSSGSGQQRPDLHVNIQIHISADASPEQIDAIFSGMRKYFD